MAKKIFISYRREDSAANALGIGQYLEHRLGRKNVFIDVDMRAGSKFPAELERRLAECKVMLVLIGPGWLDARDEQGRRRLENPDDWVRLEITQALKRDITVIPVRVNGTPLPPRDMLPDDMRGLLTTRPSQLLVPDSVMRWRVWYATFRQFVNRARGSCLWQLQSACYAYSLPPESASIEPV